MREPVTKEVNGHTIMVVPLPAMRALKLWPLASRGVTCAFMGMSADEMHTVVTELLAGARYDGKEVLGKTFDLDFAGDINLLVSEFLPLAFDANYGVRGDFSAAVADDNTAAASPSAVSTT